VVLKNPQDLDIFSFCPYHGHFASTTPWLSPGDIQSPFGRGLRV
jgi:hypothetical protein